MITEVTIVTKETRIESPRTGRYQAMKITGESFLYIVRKNMTVKEMFEYIESVGRWHPHTS